MNTSNVPGTPEEKLESLRAQALKKGREFNETAVRESLGISLPEVVDEPVAKKPSKKAAKAVKESQPKISKGKVGGK
jgi:hypothetical protein